MTHYERLGIGPDASPAEVRGAFRRTVKAVHPDRHGERTTADLAAVNEAWRVLSDPARRAAYDLRLQREADARRPQEERQAPAPAPAPPPAPTPAWEPDPDDDFDDSEALGGRSSAPVDRLRSLVVVWGVVAAVIVGMLFLYGFCRSGVTGV